MSTEENNVIDPTLIVTTDQADYAPGTTATFTVSNVDVGGTVTFDVDHVVDAGADGIIGTADDTLANDLSGTAPWTITDGGEGDLDGVADGKIVTSWAVNDDASNQAFVLTATDTATGETATAAFTDAVPTIDIDPVTGDNILSQVEANSDVTITVHANHLNGETLSAGIYDSSDVLVYDLGDVGIGGQNFDHDYIVPSAIAVALAEGTYTVKASAASTNASENFLVDDATLANLTTSGASDTVNDALFVANAFSGASGTGLFPAFVQVDGNPDSTEQGYNYDAVNLSAQFDEGNTAQFNHPVLLRDINVVEKDGVFYYVFTLDSNEPNSGTENLLSLDALQIYTADTGGLTDFDPPVAQGGGGTGFGPGVAALAYDMDGDGDVSVLTNSEAAGSGKPDLAVYIPVTNFGAVDPTSTYVYLYSAFGYQGDGYEAGSGFEEWSTPQVPGIQIVKETTDLTNPAGPGDDISATVGDEIVWTYTVTNTGNTPLSNVIVTDDNGTPGVPGDDFQIYLSGDTNFNGINDNSESWVANGDTNNDGLLDTTETWIYTQTSTAVDTSGLPGGDYDNLATVTATSHNITVTDTDPSSYTGTGGPGGFAASISIEKVTLDGTTSAGTVAADFLAGDDGITILVDEDVTWIYAVTNTGDVALSDVAVTDNVVGVTPASVVDLDGFNVGDINQDNMLDTTETWYFAATGTAQEGDYSNTGTASANDPNDDPVTSDPDPSSYFGANPQISIDKYIVCADDESTTFGQGDDTTVPNLLKGDVHYVIEVTNTGNVAISDLVVTDPAFGDQLYLAGDTSLDGIHDNGEDWTAGGDTNNDGILDTDETWTYTAIGTWAAGDQSNTATATASFTDDALHTWFAGDGDGVTDTVSYFGLNPDISINKLTNGSDNADLLQGQAITWTYEVENTGNVAFAFADVSVTDSDGSVYPTFDTEISGNGDNVFDPGEIWLYTAAGTAGSSVYTNTGTVTTNAVTDDCGDSVTPTDDDGSGYTGHARAVEGLTKGYWATHLTLWDVKLGDEKGAGVEINSFGTNPPGVTTDWNKVGGISQTSVKSTGPSSGLGTATGSGDSGLLLGDLNHDGLANDGCNLFFDLASAQALANSSVSGDARIILGSQLVAAQLNEYSGYVQYTADTSPDGLIQEAVQWLKGKGPLSFDGSDAGTDGDSMVNKDTGNDLATVQVIGTADYSLSGGALTFKSPALSSSSDSWQKMATMFSEATSGIDFNEDGDFIDYASANGEGLKNALAAYNHGLSGTTAGFVTSQDGSLIGWEDSIGGTPYDVHENAPDVFWAILGTHNITGVEWHDQTAP